MSTQLATTSSMSVAGLGITAEKAEKLLSKNAQSIPSSGDYWSPQEGDVKRVIIFGIAEMMAQHGDRQDLKAHLLMGEVRVNNGVMSTINFVNCSTRLVSNMRSLLYIPLVSGEFVSMADGTIIPPEKLPATAIVAGRDIAVISYTGKRKNSQNSFMSDRWSINKLVAGD